MKILVVAGEASADLHAGHLVERLKARHEVSLIGIGGDYLSRMGLQPIKTPREMAVVGLTEAIQKIPQTLSLLRELEGLAAKEKPDFALLLDLPDFNLRLAPKLKKLGVPVIYYISPQVWAWRSGRVKAMSECIDLLLSILPFEKPWYEKNAPSKLRVEYVGHPVLEEIPDIPYAPDPHHFVIMPGSRESEWKNLLRPMLDAAAIFHRSNRDFRFSLPVAESLRKSGLAEDLLQECEESVTSLGNSLRVVHSPAQEVLRTAKAAWIASGTATLEAGIIGVPMVVVYKVSAITAFLFKNLVGYQGPIAIVNLVHEGLGSSKRLVPEVLQDDVQPEILVSAMREIYKEPKWSEIAGRLAQTRTILSGVGNPLDNTVNAIEHFLEKK